MCLMVDHLIPRVPKLNPHIMITLCSEHMSHEELQRLHTHAQTMVALNSRLGLPPLQSVMGNFFLSHKTHCFSDESRTDSLATLMPVSETIWEASQLQS